MCKDYKQVDVIIEQVKANASLPNPLKVVEIANACIGWPYVWGAVGGRLCTVANRKSYMNSANIGEGDKNLIKKRCQILSAKKTVCTGCAYFPNDVGTRIFDCQGFIKWLFSFIGIRFSGGGCTSMWKTASNWAEKGSIDTMPKDKVCCVFRDVNGVKEHILLYDGNGNYIHCSGEVKKQTISSYKATHWAIPKGLYNASAPITTPTEPEKKEPIMITYPTVRQGSRGEVVTQLQLFLSNLGSTLQIDGIFGNGTASAVRAFQKKYGLDVDGIVGPKTWKKLLEVAGNIKPSEPEQPQKEEKISIVIPDLSKSEAEALMKKYPNAQKVFG